MLVILVALAALALLIAWAKVPPFVAFLMVALGAALGLGIAPDKVPAVLEKGVGGTLGSMAALIVLGAMFGKLVAESGAAQRIADALVGWFGERRLPWAMLFTGFVVGIPLFYNVGFVLLVPLVFAVVARYNLSAVHLGLPLLAALSVTHGFLPPHPSPTALVPLFGADMRTTLWYGLLVALPTAIVAGPILVKYLPEKAYLPQKKEKNDTYNGPMPGVANSFLTALLPVILLGASAGLPFWFGTDSPYKPWLALCSDPTFIILCSLLVGTYTLGISMGHPVRTLMGWGESAIRDIAGLLLIIAGAGMLKQVLVDSGVSAQIGSLLQGLPLHPLLLAWGIATAIRVCVGSATVAGMTAAGIVAPLAQNGSADPNLLVLAVGAGSLMLSHVNDSGFWLYKTYFNLSMRDTFRTWTLMETVVGIGGLIGVLVLDWVI
jgi:Gnt-I system high-affinity gluconate transporter